MRLKTGFFLQPNAHHRPKHFLSNPSWRPDHGLTIIEVLVTVAIFGIIAATGATYMTRQLPDYRLKGAARDLITTLQQARMVAVRESTDTSVIFSSGNGTYSYCTESGNDDDWGTLADNVCLKTVTLSTYQSGVGYGHGHATSAVGASFGTGNISYSSARVVFNSRGTCSAGYVYLANEKGTTYAIGTNSNTGSVRLKKWNTDHWEDR